MAKTEKVAEEKRGSRKVREGVVISNKMQKTIVVTVSRRVKHPEYGKFVRYTKRYYAHDPEQVCGIGDIVRIKECRPLSRLKRWKLEQVVTKAQ